MIQALCMLLGCCPAMVSTTAVGLAIGGIKLWI